MTFHRGDVVLVHFPYTSGTGSKLRPALVVQCDRNIQRLANLILAPITTTVHRSGEPTQFLIEISTPTGKQSGLLQNSVVTCENLATILLSRVTRRIGSLPVDAMSMIDDCLMSALGII